MVQLYLKNKSDEVQYAGRQLLMGPRGRFKIPFIIDPNLSKCFKDALDAQIAAIRTELTKLSEVKALVDLRVSKQLIPKRAPQLK